MKDLDKFMQNPEGMRFQKIEKILIHLGFKRRDAKGSHVIFCKKGIGNITIALHNGECKDIYKKTLLKTLILHKIIK